MSFGKIYLIRITYVLLIMTAILGCSQTIVKGNMNWISKYTFYDFYKDRIDLGPADFLPTDDARFSTFKFLDENTVFLAGSIPKRDSVLGQNNFGFIFISKDKGKRFHQILFPEENVTSITLSTKYSLVETNSNGYSPKGKNVIHLIDNETFKFQKIDEYNSNDKISYKQFNGHYVIYSKDNEKNVFDILTKEMYPLPSDVTEKNYILNDSGVDVTFLKDGNKIVAYNAITKSYKVLRHLKDSYSTIMNTFGEVTLGKANLLNTSGKVYNLDEKELFTISPKEEKGLYRYKNFASKVTGNMPKFEMRYSYDYGKTWKHYSTENFITTSVAKGYYKDKYMVLDVGFYDKNNNNHIMIGEFEK